MNDAPMEFSDFFVSQAESKKENLVYCGLVENKSAKKKIEEYVLVTDLSLTNYTEKKVKNKSKLEVSKVYPWMTMKSISIQDNDTKITFGFKNNLVLEFSSTDVVKKIGSALCSIFTKLEIESDYRDLQQFDEGNGEPLSRFKAFLLAQSLPQSQTFNNIVIDLAYLNTKELDMSKLPKMDKVFPLFLSTVEIIEKIDTLIISDGKNPVASVIPFLAKTDTIKRIVFAGKGLDKNFHAILQAIAKNKNSNVTEIAFKKTEITEANITSLKSHMDSKPISYIGISNSTKKFKLKEVLKKLKTSKNYTEVKEINLDYNKGIKISDIYEYLVHVTNLSFVDCDLDISKSFKEISSKQKNAHSSINFSGNQFVETDYQMPTQVKHLYLSNVEFAGGSLPELIKKIFSYKDLTTLDLSNIKTDDWDSMFNVFNEVEAQHLTTLYWNSNPIHSKFFDFLKKTPSIINLYLNNSISSDVTNFTQYLKAKNTITYLYLRGGDDAKFKGKADVVLDALTKCKHMQYVDISNNDLGIDAMKNVEKLIMNNPMIETIVLDENGFTDFNAWKKMCDMLMTRSKPVRIEVPSKDFNGMNEDQLDTLMEKFQKLENVEEDGNEYGSYSSGSSTTTSSAVKSKGRKKAPSSTASFVSRKSNQGGMEQYLKTIGSQAGSSSSSSDSEHKNKADSSSEHSSKNELSVNSTDEESLRIPSDNRSQSSDSDSEKIKKPKPMSNVLPPPLKRKNTDDDEYTASYQAESSASNFEPPLPVSAQKRLRKTRPPTRIVSTEIKVIRPPPSNSTNTGEQADTSESNTTDSNYKNPPKKNEKKEKKHSDSSSLPMLSEATDSPPPPKSLKKKVISSDSDITPPKSLKKRRISTSSDSDIPPPKSNKKKAIVSDSDSDISPPISLKNKNISPPKSNKSKTKDEDLSPPKSNKSKTKDEDIPQPKSNKSKTKDEDLPQPKSKKMKISSSSSSSPIPSPRSNKMKADSNKNEPPHSNKRKPQVVSTSSSSEDEKQKKIDNKRKIVSPTQMKKRSSSSESTSIKRPHISTSSSAEFKPQTETSRSMNTGSSEEEIINIPRNIVPINPTPPDSPSSHSYDDMNAKRGEKPIYVVKPTNLVQMESYSESSDEQEQEIVDKDTSSFKSSPITYKFDLPVVKVGSDKNFIKQMSKRYSTQSLMSKLKKAMPLPERVPIEDQKDDIPKEEEKSPEHSEIESLSEGEEKKDVMKPTAFGTYDNFSSPSPAPTFNEEEEISSSDALRGPISSSTDDDY